MSIRNQVAARRANNHHLNEHGHRLQAEDNIDQLLELGEAMVSAEELDHHTYGCQCKLCEVRAEWRRIVGTPQDVEGTG